jgi:hypothetical protein
VADEKTQAQPKRDYITYRKNAEHLPDFLQDFHDQKDFFKTMHQLVKVEEHPMAKDIDWVTGQTYVIDIFLWWLARHGYTIQKSRAKVEFDDLFETLAAAERERDSHSSGFLQAILAKSKPKQD